VDTLNITACVDAVGADRAGLGRVNVKGTAIRMMTLELEQFSDRHGRVVTGGGHGTTVIIERA
jgi:hypothetical protein